MASTISFSLCLRSSLVKEKDYIFCPSPINTRRFLIAPGHTTFLSKQSSFSLSSFRLFSSSDETETPINPFEWEDWEKDSGVVGIYGEPEAFLLCQRALSALQHRGQDGAGIAVFHINALESITGVGLVSDVFKNSTAPPLGTSAIGHVRYSHASVQPCIAGYYGGVAYTGKIFNHSALRNRLESLGCIFTTLSAVEIVLHLMNISKSSPRSGSSIEERLILACEDLKGAYSMVILTEGKLVAVRDPLGFRPLAMGRRSNGAFVFASETNALDVVEAHYQRRELNPGEALVVDADGIRSFSLLRDQSRPQKSKVCIFEHIYSSLPSSIISGLSVCEFRHALGEILATEYPVDCDVVIAVTESGAIPAQGYASVACIPLLHDVLLEKLGPTFNDPPFKIHSDLATLRPLHSPAKLKAGLKGKRVVVVDDSIVRAMYWSSGMLKLLKEAGAIQVHLRISCPPINGFCYYGVEVPHRLTPTKLSAEELGFDSVAVLSLNKLKEFLGEEASCFCDGCFSGNYPLLPESGDDLTEIPR